MNVDTMVYLGRLLDLYAGLLTPKQCDILRCYLYNNAGLSEIADTFHTSRQAIMDIIKRAIAKLQDCEQRLHFYAKITNIVDKIPDICNNYTYALGTETEHLKVQLIQLLRTIGD